MWNHPIWILVADGQHARVLERASLEAEWFEREEHRMTNVTPPSRELGTDRPGRVHESVGMARHGIAVRTDLHEEAEMEFARYLLDRLEHWARDNCYRRLYIMAPPRFLGHLREGLGRATRQALHGTLNKDLVKAPIPEIVAHLHEHTPFAQS